MKSNIVVRNFYMSNKQPNLEAGKTPNHFLTDYMARPDATESLVPFTSLKNSPFLQINNLGSSLHSVVNSSINSYQDPKQLRKRIVREYGRKGRTFGNLGISYSTKDLYEQAQFFKHMYDSGHTLYKMVISFRDSYLKKMKVLPPNFIKYTRGDYFGHVDQLRLRQSISHGMSNLGVIGKFNNLAWAGAVQFDANHCHCHIIAGDNTPLSRSHRLISRHPLIDRGIIPGREKRALRLGIHHSLQELVPQPHYDAQTNLEHEDDVVNTQDLTLSNTASSSKLQTLVGSLPKDKSLWSFTNKSHLMRYPNRLIIKYLRYLLKHYGSSIHYGTILKSLRQYSKSVCYSKALPMSEVNFIYHQHVHSLHVNMIQDIYSSLKNSKYKLNVDTPYVIKSSMTPSELSHYASGNNKLDLFLIHSRNYSNRLTQWSAQSNNYYQGYKRFRKYSQGNRHINPQSKKMNNYYTHELFHSMDLTDKYRYLLRYGYYDADKQAKKLRPRVNKFAKQRRNLLLMSPFVHDSKTFQQMHNAEYVSSEILDSPQFSKVIDDTATKKGFYAGKPISTVLNRIKKGHLTYVPKDTVNELNKVGNALPSQRFNGIGNSLYRVAHPNISESYYRRKKINYSNKLSDFSFRCFRRGLVKSSQMQSILTSVHNHSLPNIPYLSSPVHSLYSRDFNDVKCLDLDDTVDDFPSSDNVTIGPDSMHQYRHSILSQSKAVNSAYQFLHSTHQSSPQVDTVAHHLAYMNRFYSYLMHNHRVMPHSKLSQHRTHDYSSLRNLHSFGTDRAERLTRNYLQSINHEDLVRSNRIAKHLHHTVPNRPNHDSGIDL